MVFRDLEIDFDIFDADTAEAYEEAVKRVEEGNKKAPGDSLSVVIRRQCGLVFDFFDDLFGDGFHKQLFGERTNLTECLDAFEEFVHNVNAQRAVLENKVNTYAPNRAARRAVAAAKK